MPNYSMQNTFIPQQPAPGNWVNPPTLPPPIFNNLPMPSLQDLGIKELVPQPTSIPSYNQQPISSVSQQTQLPNF
jgi:hypothetical protein